MSEEQAGTKETPEDDFDWELDDEDLKPPTRGFSWGAFFGIVIIIIGVTAAAILWKQNEREREAAQQREQERSQTLQAAGQRLMTESAKVGEGDFETGLAALRQAKTSVSKLLQDAKAAGDDEAITRLGHYQSTIDTQLREAEAKLAELEKQRLEFAQQFQEGLQNTATSISGGKVRAPAEPKPKPEEGQEPPQAEEEPGPSGEEAESAESESGEAAAAQPQEPEQPGAAAPGAEDESASPERTPREPEVGPEASPAPPGSSPRRPAPAS
jgi:uncharacterized phage infection (PIP) family protein YhgE